MIFFISADMKYWLLDVINYPSSIEIASSLLKLLVRSKSFAVEIMFL